MQNQVWDWTLILNLRVPNGFERKLRLDCYPEGYENILRANLEHVCIYNNKISCLRMCALLKRSLEHVGQYQIVRSLKTLLINISDIKLACTSYCNTYLQTQINRSYCVISVISMQIQCGSNFDISSSPICWGNRTSGTGEARCKSRSRTKSRQTWPSFDMISP